jgi:uncharacterized protein VirK/YbjX
MSSRLGCILDAGICFFNALGNLRPTAAWLSFLEDFERQHGLPPAREETVLRPLRNFAVHRLNVSQRIALLRGHYSIISKTLPTWVVSSLWEGSEVLLGTLSGRKRGEYHLTLGPSAHCGKEGEYSFTLAAEDGCELAKLTFTLTTDHPDGWGKALLIGGLQGPTSCLGPGAKERIIQATRDLSGLRPKMAVFVAASAFAQALGATALIAVSNRTHTISADAHWQRRKLHADYDAFWIERGGQLIELGFLVPLGVKPRSKCGRRNQQRERVVTLVRSLLQPLEPRQVFRVVDRFAPEKAGRLIEETAV